MQQVLEAETLSHLFGLVCMADTARVEPTGVPAWLRLTDLLRQGIADGTYAVGGKLPSTKQLMDRHRVSMTVVRRAIDELRHEGLIVGQSGSGIFVRASPGPSVPSVDDRLAALEQRVAALEESHR